LLKTYEVNLDIEKELYSPSNLLFSVSRNDFESVEIQFTIHQDDARMDLTGTIVELGIKKPSGLVVYQGCEITSAEEGKASTRLSIQAYVEYGIHTAEIYVRNAEQMAVTTPFYFMSREAIMETEEIDSVNDWSALQQALFAYDKKPILVDGIPTEIPEYVGQMAFDIVGKRAFIANDLTTISWQLLAAGEGGGGIVSWADILGKPAIFPVEPHIHEILDVTGLQAALDGKADSGELGAPAEHTHEILDVTGLQAALDAKADDLDLAGKANALHTHTVAEVTGLQAVLDGKADDTDLAPFITESEADIKYSFKGEGGGGGAGIWGDITGTLANQTDLQNALNAKADDADLAGKADAIHTHDFASITAKPATYPPDVHTHAFVDITGKPATYPAEAHVHTVAEVTGLQAVLDGKADDGDLAAKANVADVYTKTENYNKTETYTKTEVDAIASGITQGGGTIVQDNLTSVSTTAALSANQGRILNETKSDVTHNHDETYAGINHTHVVANITDLQPALDGKADLGDLAGKADTIHTHAIGDVTGLQGALDGKADDADLAGKADVIHTHTIANVTGLQTALDGKADDADLAGKADTVHTHAFADITGKPTTYPSEAHTHLWVDITDKPATFTPSAHVHVVGDVTGLQAALDGKADDADLAGKADTVHTHTATNITDFGTAVAGAIPAEYLTTTEGDARYMPTGAAPTAHVHPIADVTGLQTALDGKADDAEITTLQANIDNKQDEPIQTTAAPVSTPTHIGQMAIDTTNKRTYVAEGATAGDWRRMAGTNYADAGDNAIMALLGGLSFWKGTQAEYDLETKDPNKLYFIVG
jgi:Phage tail repeat like/BppU N-terminal domain